MEQSVSSHRFTLRCLPLTDARQQIVCLDHCVSPADFVSPSRDQWGNALLYGVCREPHQDFAVRVWGEAVTGLADSVPSEQPNQELLFRHPTQLTAPDSTVLDFAAGLSLENLDMLAQADRVMEGIYGTLSYVPGATGVQTTAAQALALKSGVCQDYSHIMLSVLRSRGIACRYVVGLLQGEGKSHAWVEVLHQGSWYGFDPTNCQRVTDQHIKLSHGRDYQDCTINRGIFRGDGAHRAEVSVLVREL